MERVIAVYKNDFFFVKFFINILTFLIIVRCGLILTNRRQYYVVLTVTNHQQSVHPAPVLINSFHKYIQLPKLGSIQFSTTYKQSGNI